MGRLRAAERENVGIIDILNSFEKLITYLINRYRFRKVAFNTFRTILRAIRMRFKTNITRNSSEIQICVTLSTDFKLQ